LNQRIRNMVAILLVSTTAIGIFACKESTILNNNLLASTDNINTVSFPDTLPVIARTIYDDSVVTSYNMSPVYAGLGTVNDPFFGRTSAGIYLQLVPPSTSYNFPRLPDSAVLILPYSSFSWGDTTSGNAAQKFTVYRVQEQMSLDKEYYSFNKLDVDRGQALGSASGVSIDQIKTGDIPALRIRMSSSFIQMMYDEVSRFSSHPDFLDFFRGLYIEPDTNSAAANAIHYFRLDGTTNFNTAGILFFNGDSVTSAFSFSTSSCAHFNWLSRKYTPQVQQYFSSKASADTLLLQNEPGASLDIVIPDIQTIPNSLINKAELVITLINDPGDALYAPPARIYPIGFDAVSGVYSIADRLPLNSASPLEFIDGKKQTVLVGGKMLTRYSINFPRELQQAMSVGKNELNLRINGTQTFTGAYRLIAGGRNHENPDYRLKLNIVYSKIN
jgi:hypothetical protein